MTVVESRLQRLQDAADASRCLPSVNDAAGDDEMGVFAVP